MAFCTFSEPYMAFCTLIFKFDSFPPSLCPSLATDPAKHGLKYAMQLLTSYLSSLPFPLTTLLT